MAIELADALPQLVWLSGLLVCLGLVFVVDGFTRALFGTVTGAVGWIPYVGKVVTAPVDKIEQKITHALGAAEAKIDSAIGASFHKLAAIIMTTAELLIALPVLLYEVCAKLAELALGDRVTSERVTHAAGAAAAAQSQSDTLAQGADTAQAAALAQYAALGARVSALEQSIAGTLSPDITGLRERTRTIEDQLGTAWDEVRKHETALGITAFTAATAIALDELGASHIRCDSNRLLGRALCGVGPQSIEGVLGLLIGGAALLDFAAYVHLMQPLVKRTVQGVDEILKVAA